MLLPLSRLLPGAYRPAGGRGARRALPFHRPAVRRNSAFATADGSGLRSRAERHAYNDDGLLSGGRFAALLCEKAGVRSFEEFWEKYFEIRGLSLSTEEFVAQLHAWCLSVRQETPREQLIREGCLAREAHMARRIRETMETYGRVLVVTGGFHTWGLLHPEPWEPGRSLPKDAQGVYPMRYSLEAADALRGYASGMPCPGYYDAVWRLLASEEPELPYDRANLDFLVGVGRALRREGFSLAASDEICAMELARGLAGLRERSSPACTSCRTPFSAALSRGRPPTPPRRCGSCAAS